MTQLTFKYEDFHIYENENNSKQKSKIVHVCILKYEDLYISENEKKGNQKM